MRPILQGFSALIVALSLASVARHAAAEDVLHLTTEEYPPFNFMSQGEIVGLGADQMYEIMARSGIDFEVEQLPWSRAIGLAREKAMTCVFTTAHTEDRDPHFKWIEPLMVERTLLIRVAGSGVEIPSIAEARTYRTGTQTGDYTVEILRNAGFTNIDLARDLDLTLKKLLSGRVDLMAVAGSFYHRMQNEGVPIEMVAVLHEQVFAIACSLKTPDSIVTRMQKALTGMIDDGTQAEILARYR